MPKNASTISLQTLPPATNEEAFRMLKKGDIWFTAVMLRGFIELYQIDKDKTYINAFNKSLSYAWDNARDEKGLFNTNLSGKSKDERKWLLTQCCHGRNVRPPCHYPIILLKNDN